MAGIKYGFAVLTLLFFVLRSYAQQSFSSEENAYGEQTHKFQITYAKKPVIFTDGTPLGVGTSGIPAALMGVQSSFSTTDSTHFRIASFNYAEQKAATIGSIQGTEGFVAVSHPTGNVELALGTIGNIQLNTDQTLIDAVSIQGGGNTSLPGTIVNWKIFQAGIANTGHATIKNGYGLYVGTFPDGVINKYGVFVDDTTAHNYFAGNVGIGIAHPTEKLAVDGAIRAKNIIIDTDSTTIDIVATNRALIQKIEELTQLINTQNEEIKDIKEKQQAQMKLNHDLQRQLKYIQERVGKR